MKKWKLWQFSAFIIICVTLNIGGKLFANHFQLPLWLDSVGTVLCTYLCGPVCGSIVGVTGNLMYGMMNRLSAIYSLTSVALAVLVGFAAKRGKLDTAFGAMTIAAAAAAISIVISVPLNILFVAGSTGNVWGDGVIGFLREHGWPVILCEVLGQFYVDFLDKFFTLILFYLAIHFLPGIFRGGKTDTGENDDVKKGAGFAALVLALLLCGQPAPATAEEGSARDYDDYVQTVYSSNNGLPCGEANDIAQTNDGILWIGTYAGLYRYNGREFRWMDDYESVRNVNCLYVDEEGRLWIGTNDNGLSISINETIANVVDQSHGLPANSVRSIIQSSDGYYYIGTTGSMQILTLNSGLKIMNTLREVYYADDVAADSAGHVAAVTSNGRLFLMKKGQILSSRQITEGGEIFRCCCFAGEGRLLAGTSGNRIFVFDITSGGFEEIGRFNCGGLRNLKDISLMKNGDIFVTADNGIGYLDPGGNFHPINTNDFNNSIDNVLVDYQGNLWLTSSRQGLLRMARSAFRDVYSTVGMEPVVVNAITCWQGSYYFGTDRGLDVVNSSCHQRISNELSRSMSGSRVRHLLVDSRDHLWICTYGGGLIEVEPNGGRYLYNSANGSFGNRARMAYELSDGTILAGGDTGLSFIRDHRVQSTIGYSDGLIHSMILTITELPDGRILAGTDGDGIAVIVDGAVTGLLTREDGLSSEVILRTVLDEETGGVFIVTSNGLCYMDAKGTIRKLDNFPYFNNYDMWIGDDGALFVESSAGLYIVDREELLSGAQDISFDLLDARQGLNSALTANSWNYCAEDGNLFLPCDGGVFIINTQSYTSGIGAYRMMLSSVRLDGEDVRLERGRPILLNRSVSRMEMYPEILNYSIQDPNVGYFLEGFDAQWTIQPQSGLSSIVYTNLPTGEYTFHLAVFDNSKSVILGERTYSVVKEKEIYDYPWFRFYLVGVMMLAVAWFTWFVVRTQVQRTLDLQQRELALAHQQIQMGNETIIAIAKAVDAKDERTSQHSQRVSQYSVMIAEALNLPREDCENLRKAALMHDIGKIGIPDAILNKPSRLTDEEYAVMKSHTLRGAEILKDFTLIDHVVEGALHHHERFDGKGYPNGLKGYEIPQFARIIGVADAFDAMTANRVYRKQMDFDYVLGEMRKGKGTQFDPEIVDILLGLIESGQINLNELYNVPEDE